MLNDNNFQELLANDRFAIVSVSGNGCASCVAMYDIINKYADVAKIYFIEAQDFPKLLKYYQIEQINTTFFLNYGKIIGVVKGYQPEEIFGLYIEALQDKINKEGN